MPRPAPARYGVIAQLFHWIIVALVIAQYVLAEQAEELKGLAKVAKLANHKSIGMTILMLAVLRLAWRWIAKAPALPATMRGWERTTARTSHIALYTLLFLQPLSGWLMSSAKNYSVSWFNLFVFPDLIAPNRRWFEFFDDMHGVTAGLLLFAAVVHTAAALKHHFYDRDDVLRRMLPVRLKQPTPPTK